MKASAKLIKPPFFIKKPTLTTAPGGTDLVDHPTHSRTQVVCRSHSVSCRLPPSASSLSLPNPSSVNHLSSISSSLPSNHQTHFRSPVQSAQCGGVFRWHPASVEGPNSASFGGRERSVTVVLLGWLGAKQKHLKRYVEWYNARGINAVTFVVGVTELLCFDLGVTLERRVAELGDELYSWVFGHGEDGRERCLLFQTFSNTGWFTYGLILDRFKNREEFRQKISGVVVDSGGGNPWDPKVWAAGFTAAIMKKRSSTISSLAAEESATNFRKEEPSLTESTLLTMFEKLFSFIITRPDFNARLRRILTALWEHQPACSQLYLFSSADNVIPAKSVEMLVKEMRSKGIRVFSFDFQWSPHVDHFRSFPEKYSSQLRDFLQDCFALVKQT